MGPPRPRGLPNPSEPLSMPRASGSPVAAFSYDHLHSPLSHLTGHQHAPSPDAVSDHLVLAISRQSETIEEHIPPDTAALQHDQCISRIPHFTSIQYGRHPLTRTAFICPTVRSHYDAANSNLDCWFARPSTLIAIPFVSSI
jgi:hypothetical protein